MSRERGHTLLELITAMGLLSIGLATGFTLWGTEKLTSREQQKSFRRSAAASSVLHELAEDLRRSIRVVPRHEGPGVLCFFADGDVAAWYERSDRPGEIHRKVLDREGGVSPDRVVARGVDGLTVTERDALATVKVTLASHERSLTVWRRHAR